MKDLLRRCYRQRLRLLYGGIVLMAVGVLARDTPPVTWFDERAGSLSRLGVFIIAISFGLALLGSRLAPEHRLRTVSSPVRGRWLAVNSPASRVPSHGVRGYGQAYAVDLVYEPADGDRPAFGTGPLFGRNERYPAFGEPVHAMVDGTVVAASGWRRDHRTRSRTLSVIYLIVEGMIRELGGPGFVVGNHVTIRTDDGSYALVAHLRRGSVRVRTGERVKAGDRIGDCGNSGNSTEPHVHAQLMDRRSLLTAQGIPMEFADVRIGDATATAPGMPANEEHLVAR